MPNRPDRWWLVIAAGLVYVMVQLDTLSVAIALPTIQSDLNVSPGTAQWVLLGFTLPAVALGLPAGRYLDRIGKRAALTLSVTGFAVAALAASAAPTLGWLIAARVVQGGFGALLFVLMPVLASAAVRPHLRGRAMGWMFAIGPLGGIGGTVATGLLIDTVGWPSIFLPQLPLAVVVLAIGLRQLDRGRASLRPDRGMLAESGLLTVAVLAVMVGLSFTADGRFAWLSLLLLAVPPALAWRRTDSGRLMGRLLRVPGVRAPMVALWTQMAGQLTVQFLVPFYLARQLQTGSATTGLVLLALPAGMVLFSPIAGRISDAWGHRRTAIAGLVVFVAATGALARLGADWTIVDLAWRLGLMGVGVGLFTGAMTAMAMAAAPADAMGSVSAALSFARQLAIGTAPALATIVWATSGYGLDGMRLALAVAALLGLAGLYALWRAGAPRPADTPVPAVAPKAADPAEVPVPASAPVSPHAVGACVSPDAVDAVDAAESPSAVGVSAAPISADAASTTVAPKTADAEAAVAVSASVAPDAVDIANAASARAVPVARRSVTRR